MDHLTGVSVSFEDPALAVAGLAGPQQAVELEMPPVVTIVLIEPRLLTRECVAHTLQSVRRRWQVSAYASLQAWAQAAVEGPFAERAGLPAVDIVLLSTADRAVAEDVRGSLVRARALARQQGGAAAVASEVPVVLLADGEDGGVVLSALESGARGVIPSNSTLGVAVEAIQLVRAGGTYVPASSLLHLGRAARAPGASPEMRQGGFSSRQAAVLKALREGKANKTIAYELKMQESTVKVHVRNIMKKVNARNRTEVAFKTKDIFSYSDRVGA